MNGHNPAAPQKIKIAERRAMALELRKQGGSYRVIAERLRHEEGISPTYSTGQAYSDVQSELNRIATENGEKAQEVLTLDLQRLDTMLMSLWPKMLKGDYFAFDRILAVLDRRARYFNLTSPVQMNATQITAQQANVNIGGNQQVNNATFQQFTQLLQMGEADLAAVIEQQQAQLAAYSAVLTPIDQQE